MAQQLEDWAALKDGAARLAAAKGEEEGGLGARRRQRKRRGRSGHELTACADGVAALRRRWEQLEREFEEAMRSWVRRWNERSSTYVVARHLRATCAPLARSAQTQPRPRWPAQLGGAATVARLCDLRMREVGRACTFVRHACALTTLRQH